MKFMSTSDKQDGWQRYMSRDYILLKYTPRWLPQTISGMIVIALFSIIFMSLIIPMGSANVPLPPGVRVGDPCTEYGEAGVWKWTTTALGQTPKCDITTMKSGQISGKKFFDFDRKDEGDYYEAANGVLLVYHTPGCGITGNDGNDVFFSSKTLPSGCKVISYSFKQFWPKTRGSDVSALQSLFDSRAGSYLAIVDKKPTGNDPSTVIHWENACTGPFSDKWIIYAISFQISAPENADLGEVLLESNKATNVYSMDPFADYTTKEPGRIENGGIKSKEYIITLYPEPPWTGTIWVKGTMPSVYQGKITAIENVNTGLLNRIVLTFVNGKVLNPGEKKTPDELGFPSSMAYSYDLGATPYFPNGVPSSFGDAQLKVYYDAP